MACYRLASVFKEDFKTLGHYFAGEIPVEWGKFGNAYTMLNICKALVSVAEAA